MHGPVADEPHVGAKAVAVSRQVFAQVGGARLLLALEEEPDVRSDAKVRALQRVERGQQCHQRRFVVARRTRIETPLGVDGLIGAGQGTRRATLIKGLLHGRRRRLGGPQGLPYPASQLSLDLEVCRVGLRVIAHRF